VLDKKETFDFAFKEGFESVAEIISNPSALSLKLARVKIERCNDLEPVAHAELAEKLLVENQSLLCIVNRKADARELAEMLPADQTIHLSTNMCAAHRLDVLAEIRRRLLDSERLLVISTSLVEAGVDLDFPVVYRALAGLDSIAQAAGRCNREGKLDVGRTVVFMPEHQPDYVKSAASISTDFLKPEKLDRIFLPDTFRTYFNEYFFMKGTDALDAFGIRNLLPPKAEEICFQTAAEKFRLIDDGWQVGLIVPFGDAPKFVDQLVAGFGGEKSLFRKLQRFTVNVSRRTLDTLLDGDYARSIEGFDGVYYLHTPQLYNEQFGFIQPDSIDCFTGESLIA